MLDRLPLCFASRREACEVLSSLLDSPDLTTPLRGRVVRLFFALAGPEDAAWLVRLAASKEDRGDALHALRRVRPALDGEQAAALRTTLLDPALDRRGTGLSLLRRFSLVGGAELVALARELDRTELMRLLWQLDRDGDEVPRVLAELLRDRWRAEHQRERDLFEVGVALRLLRRLGVPLGLTDFRMWRAAVERATDGAELRRLLEQAREWPALLQLVRDDPALRAQAVEAFALPLADLVDVLGEDELCRRVVATIRATGATGRWSRLHGVLERVRPLVAGSPLLTERLLDLAFSDELGPSAGRELGRLLARTLRTAAVRRAQDALGNDRSHAAVDGVVSIVSRGGPLLDAERTLLIQALGAFTPCWRARAAARLLRDEDADGACARRCLELLADPDRTSPSSAEDPFPEARLLMRARRARGGDREAIAALAATARSDPRLGELALSALVGVDDPVAGAALVEALDLPWELPCGCCPEPRVGTAADAVVGPGAIELLLERYWRVDSKSHADTLHRALVRLLRADEPGSLTPCAAPAS